MKEYLGDGEVVGICAIGLQACIEDVAEDQPDVTCYESKAKSNEHVLELLSGSLYYGEEVENCSAIVVVRQVSRQKQWMMLANLE